jgi:isopentenyl-diphosphate Delta-isomerase
MEETFDVVDDDDTVIGTATRKQAHMLGHIHRSVLFFIFDGQGRVYVNQRAENKEFYPGYWSLVFGGHVDAGESYDEAVVREAKEEAGVDDAPFLIGSFKKRFDDVDRENVRVYGIRTAGRLTVDATEITQGKFMTRAELEEKMRREKFLPETPVLLNYLISIL